MTAPLVANAAIISASSLIINNSARKLSTQTQQLSPAPLTQVQEYVVICTLVILAAMLLLASVVFIRTAVDLFR